MHCPKKIKICGITAIKETEFLNEAGVDYAGFVLFYPKSKRNLIIRQAERIKQYLNPEIQSVAVTVSPTFEQMKAIEEAGFDFVQIHGRMPEEGMRNLHIPVVKAFNIHDLEEFQHYEAMDQVVGFVLDAQIPGSGKPFDWSLLAQLPHTDKRILLAGGLNPDNVTDAIRILGDRIDGVDTSSGVENEDGIGKSREKIMRFVQAVRYPNSC